MPKLSIIVPVYRAEAFLPQCIDSILAQTMTDLELILVDDGSPDRSGEICDRYAAADPRVRVIHQANQGVSAARNTGLDLAKGTFVTFVDSDDYLEPNMYETMLDTAGQYGCDLVICDCMKEFTDHQELYSHNIRPGFYDAEQMKTAYFPQLLILPQVEYPATISACTCVFRRQACPDLRYEPGIRYSEDWLFGSQLALHARSLYYRKGDAFYHYRMHDSSATHRFVPDKWSDYQKLFARMEAVFGAYPHFDFSHQLDLTLLFLAYNAVGDLLGTDSIPRQEVRDIICGILRTPVLRGMFRRLKILSLPISRKQKILTVLYRHRLGIGLLQHYYAGKRK